IAMTTPSATACWISAFERPNPPEELLTMLSAIIPIVLRFSNGRTASFRKFSPVNASVGLVINPPFARNGIPPMRSDNVMVPIPSSYPCHLHHLARHPYLLTVYRIEASIFDRGSQIFELYPGRAYARNVGSITCIRPFDGVPRLALMSQL